MHEDLRDHIRLSAVAKLDTISFVLEALRHCHSNHSCYHCIWLVWTERNLPRNLLRHLYGFVDSIELSRFRGVAPLSYLMSLASRCYCSTSCFEIVIEESQRERNWCCLRMINVRHCWFFLQALRQLRSCSHRLCASYWLCVMFSLLAWNDLKAVKDVLRIAAQGWACLSEAISFKWFRMWTFLRFANRSKLCNISYDFAAIIRYVFDTSSNLS